MIGKKSTLAAVVLGAMVAGLGCTGNGNGSSAKDIQKQIARQEAWRGEKQPSYIEFTHDGKLYVVGYPESEAAVKGGKKLHSFKKGFGFGPNGETVTFEDNKIGLGDILMEQYEAKHGKKAS